MYAVERLSSYISRGVYTVSGPFHPFGGAVDIIVVEQQDGSFKSSPWYVRFGKFQGVLKTREKIVNISVNGVESKFHMYLDHKGEAYFLKEADVEEGTSMMYSSSLSSGDERDEESSDRRPTKCKSCNFDANRKMPLDRIDANNGKIVPRTTSQRGRLLGLVFGRKSIKQESSKEEESEADITRVTSLERAEIAADLLEVRWTTSLTTKNEKKNKDSQFSAEDCLEAKADGDGKIQTASFVNEDMENGFCYGEMGNKSQSGFRNSECSVGEASLEMSCLDTPVEFHNSECSVGEPSLEMSCLDTAVELCNSESSVGEASFEISFLDTPIEFRNSECSVAGASLETSCLDTPVELRSSECSVGEASLEPLCLDTPVELRNSQCSLEEASLEMSCLDTPVELHNSECSVGEASLEMLCLDTPVELCNSECSVGEASLVMPCLDTPVELRNSECPVGEASLEMSFLDTPVELHNSECPVGEAGLEMSCLDTPLEFCNSECSVGEASLEISCLNTPIETSISNEIGLGEKCELSEISRVIDGVIDADHHNNVKSLTSSITSSEPQIPKTEELQVGSCAQFNEEEAFDERNAVLSDHYVLEEKNEQDRVQSFIYCETSGSSAETQETLYLACGGSGNSHVHAETQHETTELISEVLDIIHQHTVTERLAEDIKSEAKPVKVAENHSQHSSPSYSCRPANDEAGSEGSLMMQESYTEMFRVDSKLDSAEEIISYGSFTISSFSDSGQVQCNEIIRDEKQHSEIQPSLESIGDSQEFDGDDVPKEVMKVSPPESSDEEQFHFSDLDDIKHSEVQSLDLISLDPQEKENSPSLDSNEKTDDLFDANYESYSSPDSSVQGNSPDDLDILIDKSRVVSSPISISSSIKVSGEEVERLAESLPNMGPCVDDLDACKLHRSLSHSLDSTSKSLGWALLRNNISTFTKLNTDNKHILIQEQPSTEDTQILRELKNVLANPAVEISLCKHLLYEGMGAAAASQAFDAERLDIDKFDSLGPDVLKKDKLVVRINGHYFPWDAAAPIILGMLSLGGKQILELKGMIAVDPVEKTLEGDPSKAVVASGGSWRLWPFLFRRSRAIPAVQPSIVNTIQSDSENAKDTPAGMDGNSSECKPKLTKKKVRVITPTSEQLASLNLEEGKNTITFTFSTSMLGKQQVDAKIYLWKWNTRIVISDVDGTITKSDVLGQFMPMVGVDWSQTGVAHLFSAIKENGYQLLFLSARSISQAYITRQFLFNLKQDGKALPEGPVVISPDGLFPSLFREVIRRAPHEFKIACLEDIKALFPSDCNPFYAGFGNRDTDEISYLKVGIPLGKIFIINPKGEIVVNRLVDMKSYTSIHAVVNGIFPPTSSSEQEDYNSWNYWRLPPPIVDI